ncbi:MAG: hypothetical protein ACYDHW_02215 [Syntrophorhabdaceae bacterium]
MSPTDLLVQSAGIVTQVEQQVAAIVTAIAFVTGGSRVIFSLYKNGWENIIPYLKDQGSKFMIICTLCTPIPYLNGVDGKPGTFIGAFPRIVITAGFTQAGGARIFENLDNVKAKIRKEIKSQELGDRLLELKETSPLMDVKIKWVDAIKVRLAQLIFLLPLVAPLALLAFFNTALGTFMMATGYVISEYMAVITCGIGVNIDPGNMIGILTMMQEEMGMYIGMISGFIFHTLLIFTFTGVVIGAAVRAAIFCITFPFSVINMAFDSRKEFFFQNIVKVFAIALTPIVAVHILNVLGMAFDLCVSGNAAFKMIEAYLYADVGRLQGADVFVVAGEMYGFIYRLFIAAVLAPAVIALPALIFLARSYRIASEAIGAGFGLAASGKPNE